MTADGPTDEVVLQTIRSQGRPMATHEVLDAVEAEAPGVSEPEVLDRLVALVAAGRLVTRSDHGTVFFAVAGGR